MNAEPQAEHQWLQQLVGAWTMEGQYSMGPDQPPMKSSGEETVRTLGGLWTVAEGRGPMPDGGSMTSVITLGYDPQKKKFVGTFVASVMTYLWVYEGTLDGARKVLTLEVDGPSMAGDGTMTKYHDIIEFHSPDHRTLSSQTRGADGSWHKFMEMHYHRKK